MGTFGTIAASFACIFFVMLGWRMNAEITEGFATQIGSRYLRTILVVLCVIPWLSLIVALAFQVVLLVGDGFCMVPKIAVLPRRWIERIREEWEK